MFFDTYTFLSVFKLTLKLKQEMPKARKKKKSYKIPKGNDRGNVGKINYYEVIILVTHKFQSKLLTYYYIKFHLIHFT